MTIHPNTDGKFPALFLIPGYQGTAKTYLVLGTIFAKLGFACFSVGTPGFGETELKPDFLGKNTINAYIAGYKKFGREPFVDRSKIGIFGYSRGAIAASLLITKIKDAKAAVFGGGIYDLKKAYDELTIEGIKENIKDETGGSEKAFRERSAVFRVKKIKCPILIIHGGKDENARTTQAYLLREELIKLNKDFEFRILPNHTHGNLGGDFLVHVIDFLSRRLKGEKSGVKVSQLATNSISIEKDMANLKAKGVQLTSDLIEEPYNESLLPPINFFIATKSSIKTTHNNVSGLSGKYPKLF